MDNARPRITYSYRTESPANERARPSIGRRRRRHLRLFTSLRLPLSGSSISTQQHWLVDLLFRKTKNPASSFPDSSSGNSGAAWDAGMGCPRFVCARCGLSCNKSVCCGVLRVASAEHTADPRQPWGKLAPILSSPVAGRAVRASGQRFRSFLFFPLRLPLVLILLWTTQSSNERMGVEHLNCRLNKSVERT